MQLLPAGPLDPPQNITMVNMSAFTLLVKWYPPNTPNGIITMYTLYFTYENRSREIIAVNGTVNSYILEGLSPHQLVYVSISSSTAAGQGPNSVQLYSRTSQTGKCNLLR